MKRTCRCAPWAAAALMLALAIPAAAELENITVGGQLRIRAQTWRNAFNGRMAPTLVRPERRYPADQMIGRPIGDFLGGQDVVSYYDWDTQRGDYHLVQQRTTLAVTADFTQEVRAVIELEAFDAWGEDFRSDYATGVDLRAGTGDDVEVYQGYIEASEMYGSPLRLRVGRQELSLGSGWLIGNNLAHPEFGSLSFDGARLTYAADTFSVDAFMSKLAENGTAEEDGDVDFYGLYASYTGIPNVALDAYYFLVRDARRQADTDPTWARGIIANELLREGFEDAFDRDDYDPTLLNTAGLRLAGTLDALDFEIEGAYQWGNASAVGALFKPKTYGDDRADFDAWAANAEVGYTLDVTWRPRFYLGAAYFGGEDNRDISFWQWINPFDRPQASVSFNRLFSDKVYSVFLDDLAQASNFWTARAGASVKPTENLDFGVDVAYLATIETFDLPHHFHVGHSIIPVAALLSFWTVESDAELGWEAGLWARYRFSEDLTFTAGWEHLFTGEGLRDGNYSDYYGLLFNGGIDDTNEADYFYAESELQF